MYQEKIFENDIPKIANEFWKVSRKERFSLLQAS